ncbi:MAG: hypothetical protein LH649_14385, partial [Pseudanabaena sp. CAN_BIN31]|nr:hypothetical protein [Pseudanabaena sp. CAN_BIN31]
VFRLPCFSSFFRLPLLIEPIRFFDFVRDRISQLGNIPSLHTIIRELSSLKSFGYSWSPE